MPIISKGSFYFLLDLFDPISSSSINTLSTILTILSITILVFGIYIAFLRKSHEDKYWLLLYLCCLLSMESSSIIIGLYIKGNVYFLFILSFFIQFLFLTYFYCSMVFQISLSKRNTILYLGLLPFLIYTLPDSYRSFFQYYDRLPYSFSIMLYSLIYIYALINGSLPSINSRNILNAAILLFFTLDAFWALGTKYLFTENSLLVSGFWVFRAIFLQAFYLALIYYGWKSSKSS